MRSKGSPCGCGQAPARSPWAKVIGRSSKRCSAQYDSSEPGGAHRSLPRRTLVAISQAVAALTTTVVVSSSTRRRTFRLSALSAVAHQIRAWVSSSSLSRPTSALSSPPRRQRLEECVAELDRPLQCPGRALGGASLKRDQPRVRFTTLGDDDLLAGVRPLEELREVGLRLM